MILDIFKYYAQFPNLSGVQDLFVNGKSSSPVYAQLLEAVKQLPLHDRLPEINHYVFGQSYDDVKAQVDKISGTYLFVEFGDIDSKRDQRNTITDTFQIAVTVASKVVSNSDLIEIAIISEETLQIINQLRILQFSDQSKHPWLKEISEKHRIVPFVAKEFSSIGWTMIFNREGADMLNLKDK